MMGSAVPIIELLSDGEYYLNEEVLALIASEANECQNIALISIVGSNQSQNEFVLNCLTDYLDSQHSIVWPEMCHTLNTFWSVREDQNRPLVRMWSKPFIKKVDDQNTAIFLMDSTQVFDKQNELLNTKLTKDIIGLFCSTSSTIIFLKAGQLVEKELEVFRNTVETFLNRDFTTDSFEELIYLITDWDPNRSQFKNNNYLFGAMGGHKYMEQEFAISLDQCFTQTICYLLPSIGIDVSAKDLSFDKMNFDFIKEFSQLIKNKLLNIDEMQKKMGRHDQTLLKVEQLLPLFRQSVNQLNQSICGDSEETLCEDTEDTNEKILSQQTTERERSVSSRSSLSIEVIKEEDSFYYMSSDEEQGQNEPTNLSNDNMTDDITSEEESLEMWGSVDEPYVRKPSVTPSSADKSNHELDSNLSCHLSYESLTLSDMDRSEMNSSCGENMLSEVSAQPSHQKTSVDQQNNALIQKSNELTEEIMSFKPTKEMIETDLDEVNVLVRDRTNSDESQQSSGEDYFTDLSYEAKDLLNNKELIEKFKNLHLTELKNFSATSRFITREEFSNKHHFCMNYIKVHFNEELKSQNPDIIEKLNKSLDSEFKLNYEEVGHQVELKRSQLIDNNLIELIAMFCERMNARLKGQEEIQTKEELEKHFQETEDEVHQYLRDKIREKDQVLSAVISVHLTERLDGCRDDFRHKMLFRWNNSMKEFKDICIKDYKNRMSKTILEKKFNSVQDFHQLLKDIPTKILKNFDFKFHITDGFTDNYEVFRNQIKIQLNDINEELHKDFTFREVFEKSFSQSVGEYDKTMKSLIETKLENQNSIFDFKLTEAELNGYHIQAKNSLLELIRNKHEVSKNKIHKFSLKFEDKFIDVLSQKRDNYLKTVRSVENYLKDWKKELTEREYLEDIDERNQIIIQRRRKFLDEVNQYVKDYSLELFHQIYPDIKQRNQNKKDEFREKYEIIYSKSVKNFENLMRHSIESRLNHGNYDVNLDGIYEGKSKDVLEHFKEEIKKFDKTDGCLNEFMHKLERQMTTKKAKFQSALDQIAIYRQKWTTQLNASLYLSEETMRELNKSLSKEIISSGDEELDSIVNKSLNKLFDIFIEAIDDIGKREAIVAENTIKYAINLFEQRFDNRLRSGLFTQNQVNAMFDKLLEYTIKVVIKRCNFNEHQKNLTDNIKEQLTTDLRKYLTRAFAQHSQNSVNVKNTLKHSVDSSLEYYVKEIQKIFGSEPEIKRSKFNAISESLRIKSLKHNESQIESLTEYFNQDFYQKLLTQNKKEINTKINSKEKNFLNFVEKNTPKEISIALYFGYENIYSVRYENGSIQTYDSELDIRPNSIAIDQKIMVGYEAQDYYQKSNKQMNENFDIKTLLRRSSFTTEEKNIMPFHKTYEQKVRVIRKELINDLSVESLIAAQVLDIKENIENEMKAIVNSTVFTVPTHFNIKQRNAMKDVANIAGVGEPEILSEITAAAISYANDVNQLNRCLPNNVLLIAMNGHECEAANCEITSNQIKYKSHFQHKFTAKEISTIRKMRKTQNNNRYERIKTSFKILTEDISKNTIEKLKNIVIIGSSDLIQDLKYYIIHSKKYEKKIIYECDPIEIIVKGTALYGSQSSRSRFDITDVSLYPISFYIKGKTFALR